MFLEIRGRKHVEDMFIEIKEEIFQDIDKLRLEAAEEEGVWYVLVDDLTYDDEYEGHSEWVMVETNTESGFDFEQIS